MSVERRINVPSRDAYASTVERLKDKHELDALLAEYIRGRLPEAEQEHADMGDILRRVKRQVDPRLVDVLYEPMRAK